MGETPKMNTKLRDIGELDFKILWESPDGKLFGSMVKQVDLMLSYRGDKIEMKFAVHRGWTILRLKHELSYYLNISGARIRCYDGPFMKKDGDDLESLWMGGIGMIVIDDNSGRFPYQSVNAIESEGRQNATSLLFKYGEKWSNLRFIHSWTFKELYWVLYINGIISNPRAENWNFFRSGANIKCDADTCIMRWKKVKSETIVVSPAMVGGGLTTERLMNGVVLYRSKVIRDGAPVNIIPVNEKGEILS
jgi:hypothetical protein